MDSLTLNEEVYNSLSPSVKSIFVLEWLRRLESSITSSTIKDVQKKLVAQLMCEIEKGSPGPPTRYLLSSCLTSLFKVGDTFLLFETINKLNDLLKNKDDSPSFLPTRLSAIHALGNMYESLGRMTGRSYEETVSVLNKGLKSAESQTRCETMNTFAKISAGLGNAASNIHRDIYKSARAAMTDRSMAVRTSAAGCLLQMGHHSTFLHTTELENVATLCFRAFDGANYETRKAVAKLLGQLVSMTLMNKTGNNKTGNIKLSKKGSPDGCLLSIDDALGILMQGFLKGGSGSGLIKGGSPVTQDVRVGVTHCYVVLVQILGGSWLERNITQFLTHVLELVSHPKAANSHVDAVYSRRCVGFIVQILLGKLLGEKAQLSACKEIINIIAKLMNSMDFNSMEKEKDNETIYSQHLLVVALQELGNLLFRLGTSARSLIQDNHLRLTDTLLSVLLHPCQAPRLASAWSLRCLCIATPSHLTPSIDRCLEGLDNLKASAEAISGYSGAISALLGAVRHTPLGIPHTRGKVIFNVGEELLRSASQNSRLSRERTQAGWLLIGAIMTLGPSVVKGLLPRMMLLWRNAFPRSKKDLKSEKARGDAFTWKISLEARAGALATIHSFLQNCTDLLNDDIIRRISVPVESCLVLLTDANNVLKSYTELKALKAMLRLRFFEVLSLLPPSCLDKNYPNLLQILVSEFILSDGSSNTSTSLLRHLCHSEDSVILGTRFQDSEDAPVEDQLLPNSASGSVALEHDLCSLYRFTKGNNPGLLPLGVSVVDAAINVFGIYFPWITQSDRLKILLHFDTTIKTTKANRLEAIQMNIFASILSGLKGLLEVKANLGNQAQVKTSMSKLIISSLTSTNPMLRCAAGEALGRMAQVVSDSVFVAEMAQKSFDCINSARDVISRTGHSLALGCLHRYVGGMATSQHLYSSVTVLLALAQDVASPQVQVWALHALALIADSGGPMFRSFVEPTLSTTLKLLLSVQSTNLEVMSCLGRVLSALITTVGPELAMDQPDIVKERSSFLCACGILQNHEHPVVQAEAISCLQQLHMFAPKHVDLSAIVPNLCHLLQSNHLVLRQASVSALRQFSQRESKEVCSHANKDNETNNNGLPGMLFQLLDLEMDSSLINNIHDTLNSIMMSMASDNLTVWLSLLKEVLTVANEAEDNAEVVDEEEDSDVANFTEGTDESKENIQPRWPTRVFAAASLRKIISECCQGDRAHYDLGLAKEIRGFNNKNDYLVLHLSELVRVSFMAATSDSDPLRLEGLRILEVVINKFGDTPEPEFPGHVILEQYQAQVGAALRPAFSPDTASHITSAACDVCSAWIGSGVARDLSDLRRVYTLLVTSLGKLRKGAGTQIYNESAFTLEKLSILKAWAEVYIVSMKDVKNNQDDDEFGDFDGGNKNNNLASLVQSELPSLSKHWIAALKDHALLSLPPEFKSQLPYDGGAFYTNDTMESARSHYRLTWPQMLQASAVWLTDGLGFKNVASEKAELDVEGSSNLGLGAVNAAASKSPEEINTDRFYLLFGVCMEALSNNRSAVELTKDQVSSCVIALKALIDNPWVRSSILSQENDFSIELCNVLHRTVLTRDRPATQILVLDVLSSLLKSRKDNLEKSKKLKLKELIPANQEQPKEDLDNLDSYGEGSDDGEITPGKSVVFASLEVCLCVLIRHYPNLSPRASNLSSVMSIQAKKTYGQSRLTGDTHSELMSRALNAVSALPFLCSTPGNLKILPSVMYLITGVLREVALKDFFDDRDAEQCLQVKAALQGLRNIIKLDLILKTPEDETKWHELLQSSLLRILDLNNYKEKTDDVIFLLSITVFINNAPYQVITAPNILAPSIDVFKSVIVNSDESKTKLRCLQSLQSIFQNPDKKIANAFISSLAPSLIENLLINKSELKSEIDLKVTLEALKTLELLMTLSESHKLLDFFIPITVSFLLCDGEEMKASSKLQLQLHEYCLAKLTRIGQSNPKEFKNILTSNEVLKCKLEGAVRANQQRVINAQSAHEKNVNAAELEKKNSKSAAPSITLTTDFSKFAAK